MKEVEQASSQTFDHSESPIEGCKEFFEDVDISLILKTYFQFPNLLDESLGQDVELDRSVRAGGMNQLLWVGVLLVAGPASVVFIQWVFQEG